MTRTRHTGRRRAATLIETLLVVGVLAALAGLLLPAVQKVRDAAIRLQSANRLRQINIALHHYLATSGDSLPGPLKATEDSPKDLSTHYEIRPFIEGEPSSRELQTEGPPPPLQWWRPVLLSPADPTLDRVPFEYRRNYAPTSYSTNMTAFAGRPQLPHGIPDGTSGTIAFAERYAYQPPKPPTQAFVWCDYNINGRRPPHSNFVGNHPRRATFADAGISDVVPVTTGSPPVTRSSEPGVTFQLRPSDADLDMHVLQSPYPHGLQTAFFDGSVRFLRAGISEAAFWGMVTRDGGEVIPD
jgi:type II secretory pathway pseudopilin PulG